MQITSMCSYYMAELRIGKILKKINIGKYPFHITRILKDGRDNIRL